MLGRRAAERRGERGEGRRGEEKRRGEERRRGGAHRRNHRRQCYQQKREVQQEGEEGRKWGSWQGGAEEEQADEAG
eukprot:3275759-Rhodomonas_salina.1